MQVYKKCFFFKKNLLSEVQNKNKPIYIKNRNLTIIPEYTNLIFYVYNGKTFLKLNIKSKMVGFKFGEFVFTRKRHQFKVKKNKKKK